MLRLIVWTATIWFVLVFFTGCAQQQPGSANLMANQDRSRPDQIIDAEKAKTPPITATTYYTTGLLMENQGDYAGAVDKFIRAIDSDPQSIPAYNHLGLCYTRLRNYQQAEETYKQALQRAPQLPHLHNNLGFVYLLQNKFVDAEAELRNALASDPGFRRAHSNLGVALAKQGKTKEALDEFFQACSRSEAYYNLGVILHSQGKVNKAEQSYRLALKLDPNFEPAQKGLEQIKNGNSLSEDKVTMNKD